MKENVLLAPLTTLRVGGPSRYFTEVGTTKELIEALSFSKEHKLPIFILGGGSNILVSDDGFLGVTIKINIKGKNIVEENGENVLLRVSAGEQLDELIAWTVGNGWWGMENLSFIPGLVGALVIQNVNAYGVKAEHFVESVEVYDMADGVIKTFSNSECKFRYRGTIFNKEEHGRYIILSLDISLRKNGIPIMGYVDIQKHFAHKDGYIPALSEMREVITSIRRGKGFDPEKFWSAGSFFSNLMLSEAEVFDLRGRIVQVAGEELAQKYDVIVKRFYEDGEKDSHLEAGKVKIPTGFLLDQVLGLKGFKKGGVYVSTMHAQTFINSGNATAQDVYDLYWYVKNLAKEKLGIELVHEPEFVGFE